MSISVRRAEGYVDFCEDLSLRAEWEEANEAFTEARRRPDAGRLVGDVSEKAARVRELEAAMENSVVRIKVRAIGRKRWQEIGAQHPPRDDNDQDAAYGVNVSTFFDAVATEPGSIFAAVEKVSGEVRDFDPKTEWEPLADSMSDGQYGEFVQKFLELNRGGSGRPFSRAALLTEASDKTSRSQSGSESLTSD